MLICPSCGTTYDDLATAWRCSCGSALEYGGSRPPFSASLSSRSSRGGAMCMWRYREAFPYLDEGDVVTLGEGGTPLIEMNLYGIDAGLKLDYLCPTGSFKDRGASAMMSVIRKAGVARVVEDSSGNAGASVAAYAARAGIGCTVFVPASNSPAKLAQIRAYGADLAEIPGTRQDVAEACRKALLDTQGTDTQGTPGSAVVYASHNWNPFFIEGVKTVAYEIWEHGSGRFRSPDWVIVPSGYGSMTLGMHRGFKDLLEWGRIGRMPRLAAVQALNCAPVFQAYSSGSRRVSPVEPRHTAAEGIACSIPIRGDRILSAIEETGGLAMAVSEEEILKGAADLASAGLYVETTSGVVAAALKRLVWEGTVGPEDNVVAVLSGTGLKSGGVVASGSSA